MIAAVVGLIILAAFCAATENALSDASRAKLDNMLSGDALARADRLLERYDVFSISADIYRTLFETAAVAIIVLHKPFGPASAIIPAIIAVLFFSEIIPRLVVARSPENTLLVVLPPFSVLATPIIPLAKALVYIASRVRPHTEQPVSSAEEDILSAVAEGEKEGTIDVEQADMIQKIIDQRDADVGIIMTPRPDIVAVRSTEPVDKIVELLISSGHSRVPVFRQTRDDIIGILYIRDVLEAVAGTNNGKPMPPIERLVRSPHFVPETMEIRQLIHEFQDAKTTMAIVVDEYGGTAGIVTIRDIVDRYVGEIRDRHEPQRQPMVEAVDDFTIRVDARAEVRALNDDYSLTIPESDEYDTIGGYLSHSLGRVPRIGDKKIVGNAEITVLAADERRVRNVRIMKKSGFKSRV